MWPARSPCGARRRLGVRPTWADGRVAAQRSPVGLDGGSGEGDVGRRSSGGAAQLCEARRRRAAGAPMAGSARGGTAQPFEARRRAWPKPVKHPTEGSAEERAEVAKAIRTSLFPLSLRQGVTRLLARLGLDQLRKEWDRLYGIRSGLFHGTARLSDSEINQAAMDTVTLCGRIPLQKRFGARNRDFRDRSFCEFFHTIGG